MCHTLPFTTEIFKYIKNDQRNSNRYQDIATYNKKSNNNFNEIFFHNC